MKKDDRYLAALLGDEADGTSNAAKRPTRWPDAIAREPFQFRRPIVCQFLDDECIDEYLEGLEPSAPGARNGARNGAANGKTHRNVVPAGFAGLGESWTADKHPLVLCEFLAYKSGLVYRSPKEIRRDLLGFGPTGRRYAEGIEQYVFFDSADRQGDTQALAFVHAGTGYVIFRGASGFVDLATDRHDDLTDQTYPHLDTVPQTLVGAPKPARHTGYAIAWGSIAPDVEAWTNDQMQHGRIKKVVLSGHAHGGALAILAAHHFARRRICPLEAVITFGAPMVGGADFKAEYEDPRLGLKQRTLRVEAADDPATFGPIGAGDYDHVGHVWRFRKRPIRPTWQMQLLSPIINVEEFSRKSIESLQKKARTRAKDRARGELPGVKSNQVPTPPTWRQFVTQSAMELIWFFARIIVRVFAARSAERRYGVYLSTLSYRKIRAHHMEQARLLLMTKRGQETERIVYEKAFRDAGEDLGRHLGVVRGRHPKTFRHLLGRPVRIETPAELAALEKRFENYIA